MTPDPFRALDRIDPSDQWEEISRRALAPGVDLDLGAVPDIRPRRRAAALVAVAAAVLAVVAGTVVATSGGGDEDVTFATDPSTTATPAVAGACPFTLDPAAGLPALAPGRSPVDNAEVAPAEEVVTWGHVTVDDLPVEVAVSGTAGEPSIRADGTLRAGEGAVVLDVFSDAPRVTVEAWEVVADEGPCSTVTVFAHVPLRPEDAALAGPGPDGDIPTDADLAPYLDIARPTVDRVRQAVRLAEPEEQATTTSTLPADQLALAGDCPFRLEQAAGIGPLTAIERPEDANAQRSDRPSTWGSLTIGGVDVRVGVGEADPQRSGTPGRIELYESGGGQDPDIATMEASVWIAEAGACSFVSARAYLPAAAPPEETSSTVGERMIPPSPEEMLVRDRLHWAIDVVLGAVVVDGADVSIECSELRHPDATTAPSRARCPQGSDPTTLPPVTFPEDDGEPQPPEPPSPAARPGEVYFEAEAWDGFPIYVARGQRGVCVSATAGSESCSGGDSPKGLSMVEVPDPETGEPGGVVLLGARPDGAVSTEVRSADGPVPGAVVTVAPDGLWFVAWVPIPFEELGMEPWPIAHRDAAGAEIPL